jgi:hypothetical protein
LLIIRLICSSLKLETPMDLTKPASTRFSIDFKLKSLENDRFVIFWNTSNKWNNYAGYFTFHNSTKLVCMSIIANPCSSWGKTSWSCFPIKPIGAWIR